MSTNQVTEPGDDVLKSDLQEINYRLSHYIQHVRDIRQTPGGDSTAQLHNSLTTLEQEIRNLKNIYEAELDTMRHKYSELQREKSRYEMEVKRFKTQIYDFEERLNMEADARQQAVGQAEVLQRTVMQREQELREARDNVRQPLDELAEVQRNASGWWSQLQDMTKSCDNERLKRQEAEDRLLQMQKKLEFNDKIHEQEKADQTRRVKDMARSIIELEQKVEELSKPDNTVAEMVQQAQMMAETEIRNFQEEAEKYFARSLAELKGQLDEQMQHSRNLNDDVERLKAENAQLSSKVKTVSGELAVANQERLSLEELLRREQSQAQSCLQTMERRLKDLQDLLVVKMREAVTARDAQGLLKTEIDTLRAMLGDEERRLRLSTSCCITAKANGVSTRPVSGSALPALLSTPSLGASGDRLLPGRMAEQPSHITAPSLGGPIRIRSASAVADRPKAALVPATLGWGREYFDEMYKDVKAKPTITEQAPETVTTRQPKQDAFSGQNMYTSSAIGDLKILEVSSAGHFIRLINASMQCCEEFGGYVLQQNVAGKMMCYFRVPQYTKFLPNTVITVWASGSKEYADVSSDTEFVCDDVEKWGCGPEFTTILCKPNGQAIAWMTASNPYKALHGLTTNGNSSPTSRMNEIPVIADEGRDQDGKEDAMVASQPVSRASLSTPVYTGTNSLGFQQESEDQFAFYAMQRNDALPYVPNTEQLNMTTLSKQSPIPGAPYAGAPAQRMGSAKLRQYAAPRTPQPPTIQGRGVVVKKQNGTIKHAPGSPFVSPLQQDFAAATQMGRTGLLA